ncbi:hypothetical protein BGZ61DRAFT_480172 [Ilyonectria robusta]|uniref:uncharacterized protein n=1 Tax=Ilyonectria robusta TaxID=1079257 RepID=UPI001E8E5D7E|nr:uncharacterized protein BGZ61DRAFT_480172 [Ilyonectria robusta]KAH8683890.1 hypothetical protein BGZ61DRAFT_480172 [Ilyonectria robusta]
MSYGHRQPSPLRNKQRHSREQSWRRRFKERFKEKYDALKRKASLTAADWAILFVKYAALEWKPGKPLPELPSHRHRRRPEPDRHRSHRERSPEQRGRRRRHHGSRRELRDASYHRWPHGSSISTPRPTRPRSPHSHTRSHARRRTHTSEDNEDFDDIGAYGHGVLHTGFDPSWSTRPKSPHSQTRPYMRRPTRLYDGDKDIRHVQVYGCGVPHPDVDSFDTSGDSDDHDHAPSDSDYSYDSDLSETLSGSGIVHNESLHVINSFDSEEESTASLRNPQPVPQGVLTTGFDHFDTLSDSDDGYDSDLSEALSGLGIDHNEGLHVVTPSDSEEESTASLRGPQPEPQGVPSTSLKHTSADPGEGYPDVPPSLHATSDTDFNDTAPDSGEDDAGNTYDTPSSSYQISVSDDGECSGPRSCSSDSDGDEEEIVRQATILPLQSVKADLGSTVSNSNGHYAGDSYDSPPSSHQIRDSDEDECSDHRSCSSDSEEDEEDEEENVRQAAGPPLKVVKVELGDMLPNSKENRDAPPSSSPPDPSEDYPVENIRNAGTSPPQVVHVDSGDNYSDSDESEDGDPAADLSPTSINASPEGEGEVDSLDQDEAYASTSPIASPEKLERASAIASVVPLSSQDDVTGPGDSKAESIASHNASGTETPGPRPQPSSVAMPSSSKAVRSTKRRDATKAKSPMNLDPGSIVRRVVGDDKHPYLVTQNVLHNGNPAVVAHPCTSRPQKEKFRNQYQEQTETHYVFLGGIIEGNFDTDGIPKPKVAELDIQGPPMPKQTYIKLEEHEPFDPNDFVPFGPQKRELPPESLEKFLNLYRLHGCKRVLLGASPPRNRKYSCKNLRSVTPRRSARRPPPPSKRRRQRRQE